jgi:hypothetical protein
MTESEFEIGRRLAPAVFSREQDKLSSRLRFLPVQKFFEQLQAGLHNR